jgi:hypothetical protein
MVHQHGFVYGKLYGAVILQIVFELVFLRWKPTRKAFERYSSLVKTETV